MSAESLLRAFEPPSVPAHKSTEPGHGQRAKVHRGAWHRWLAVGGAGSGGGAVQTSGWQYTVASTRPSAEG